jgi:DUF4097 and DUF4098 domain-containing protein YvlB
MKRPSRLLLAVALLIASHLVVHAEVERVVEKTFPVTSAGLLEVETHAGSIRVVPTGDATVRVTARQRIKASSEAEADDLLAKLELSLEQIGNDVRLAARYPRRPAGFRWGGWPPVQVDFEVKVPADFATRLMTSGGPITVGDLNGKAELRTSGGSIKLGQMGGPVDARTSGGGITLAAAHGPVQLKTSGGQINVGRVSGPADVATSGGGITIDSVAGQLRAHTSGGGIRANITGPLSDDCSLSTSGGSVRVTVDRRTAFRLDASTSGGGVDATGVALTTEKSSRNRSQLAGVVNGGGPLLKLRTSGGGISVRGE